MKKILASLTLVGIIGLTPTLMASASEGEVEKNTEATANVVESTCPVGKEDCTGKGRENCVGECDGTGKGSSSRECDGTGNEGVKGSGKGNAGRGNGAGRGNCNR